MLSRRSIAAFFSLAPVAFFAAQKARAATSKLYTQAAFDAAKKSGAPIIVHFWAGWCSTCKAQEAVLEAISPQAKYKDLVILSVNIDTQHDVMRAFNVRDRSYLIAFKAGKEVNRAVGITSRNAIETFTDSAI